MSTIPVYRDLLGALQAGQPLEPVLQAHWAFFAALDETYGPDQFGPGGAAGALERLAPALGQALAPSPSYRMETRAGAMLREVTPVLPGMAPDLYLGTLLFIAPAATLCVRGAPAIALGMERFHPAPPSGPPKYWYHPDEVVEMIPHEAAHAARMQALDLLPTPRRLSLLDMVMLEGTALTFTDLLLGKETLATFMPPDQLAHHRAHDSAMRAAAALDFGRTGMDIFTRYFGAGAPVSGYYVGYSLCREYLDRFGDPAIRELISLPSIEILHRLLT